MKEIDSQNSIVAFIDILGYKAWVKETKDPNMMYEVLKRIMDTRDKIKEKYPMGKEFLDRVEFTIWSDSLIYIIPLDSDIQNRKLFVSWFLYFLSMTTVEFISETGYFLRGGISHGQFLQKKITTDEHRFISSKAYIEAVELEKKAENPRILLSTSFVNYATSSRLLDDVVKVAIQQDIYKQYYLDYYFFLHLMPGTVRNNFLEKIKNHLSEKFKAAKEERVIQKYLYFFHYHNVHVRNMFEPQLKDEDFKSFGLDKASVLIALRDLGIVHNDGDFFIKEDVERSGTQLIARLLYPGLFKEKARPVAEAILNRINLSDADREKYYLA